MLIFDLFSKLYGQFSKPAPPDTSGQKRFRCPHCAEIGMCGPVPPEFVGRWVTKCGKCGTGCALVFPARPAPPQPSSDG